MTPFDYAVLVILLASMALGAWRGVLGEIIAVAAWVLAFFAAKWWGEEFARQLLGGIGDPVVLWGEGLPVERVSDEIGTIPYELITKLTSRVFMEYV